MATIILDSEYKDELLHINEDPLFEYGSPFVMDDLYSNDLKVNVQKENLLESCRASDCSSEEEEYEFKLLQPTAPPPSPQDSSMLDMLFASKLTSSLEACLESNTTADKTQINDNDNSTIIDKLSIKSSHHNNRGICKKTHKRSCSLQQSWQSRVNKTTEQADKLRKALQKHLMDEDTFNIINEMKDMGL